MSDRGPTDEDQKENICYLSLTEVAGQIRNMTLSPAELVRTVLERIERRGPELGCYVTVAAAAALREADDCEQMLRAGEHLGPLHGVPISLKDNIATKGLLTTAGSRVLADWLPAEDATVAARLRAAGAIVIAKAQLSEFAYGAPNPDYGVPLNPWNVTRSTGGSSNGSAVALAAGLCYGSVGTDTGGSVRIPAAMCGVVGMKPTYDLVSRQGVVPVSHNLDHVGPMARTVADAAALLEVISEPGSVPAEGYTGRLARGVEGLRLGILPRGEDETVDEEVWNALERTYAALESEGARLAEVRLPDLDQARAVMWTIAGAELAEYQHANLRDRPEEFGPEVRLALEAAEFTPATGYIRAQRVRRSLIVAMRSSFEGVDALVLPAAPVPAHPIALRHALRNIRQRFTTPFNLTGQPALVVPIGFSADGLPICAQVVGPSHHDGLVLQVGSACERAAGPGYGTIRPRLAA